MSILENKIRKNIDQFDVSEPSEGHFDRFSEKLDELHDKDTLKIRRNFFSTKYWRIAAVVLILISISTIVFLINPRQSSVNLTANELPEELQEVKMYYSSQANAKMKQIEECALTDEDAAIIHELAAQEIEELEKTSAELESALKENDKNEKVRDALIVNYKTRAELLDNIIQRLCNI